ncbi:MAG: mechanosensitive ion channel family protein [Solirubrobacterales bacterium]
MHLPLVIAATREQIERACGEEAHWVCREVFDRTDSEFLADAAEWVVTRGVPIVLIIIGAYVVTLLARRAIDRSMRRVGAARLEYRLANREHARPDQTEEQMAVRSSQRTTALSGVLASLVSVIVWLVAAFLVLTEFGIDVAPLIAGAGVAGIALGFGAQSLVRDYLAGIFILIEDQFAVGDVVDLGEGEAGIVEDLSLRRTRLRSVDGSVWHVPNGQIVRVGNMSQHWARALLDVEVAYSTDLESARRVIKGVADQVAADDPDVLGEPEVWGVESLGASAIALRLVVKTKPSEQWRIMRRLRELIKEAFDAEGIEIPFPQQTVWMRPDDPESRAEAAPAPRPGPPTEHTESVPEGEWDRTPGAPPSSAETPD